MSVLKRSSLWFLNIAQAGAVINDNIFKLVMVFILIERYGPPSASTILSGAGAVYVLPFLLFSSAAGILADRYSKKWIISALKVVEVVIFAAAIFAVKKESPWGLYFLLFCLATHSAAFGPSKYSIIPELVSSEKVPKANGLITSCTYLAIIIGTFLASFLSEMTDCRYVEVMLICLALAVIGLLSALCIRQTPRQGSTRKIHLFFLKEIYNTLQNCRGQPHLLLVITSSAFFLFIGAYTQLNIIPYALQALDLSEIYGGYLFLCTALGIALGSLIIGKILKRNIALWIPCVAGFGLSLFFLALAFDHLSLPFVIFFLVGLGITGGMFVVPLDSFVQLTCSNETRGQVIAAGNFLGFCGVLLSSILLFLLSDVLSVSAMGGFGIIGIATLLYAAWLFFRLSDYTLPLLVKTITRPTFTIELTELDILESHTLEPLVLPHGSLPKCALIAAIAPHYHFVFVDEKSSLKKLFFRLFYSVHVFEDIAKEKRQAKTRPTCFVLPEDTIPSFLPGGLTKVEIIPSEESEAIVIRFSKR